MLYLVHSVEKMAAMVRMVKEEGTMPRGVRTKVVACGDPSIQGLTSEILGVQIPMEPLPQTSKQLFRPCVPEVTEMRGKSVFAV